MEIITGLGISDCLYQQYVRIVFWNSDKSVTICWLFSSFNGFRVFVDGFHQIVVFNRSAAQLGFNVLDAFLFFVGGCIPEDEIHVFKRL